VIAILPASILEKSRMSLITASSECGDLGNTQQFALRFREISPGTLFIWTRCDFYKTLNSGYRLALTRHNDASVVLHNTVLSCGSDLA
jgi:hypothetical protein